MAHKKISRSNARLDVYRAAAWKSRLISEFQATDISKNDGAIKASCLISGGVVPRFIKILKEIQASATKFSSDPINNVEAPNMSPRLRLISKRIIVYDCTYIRKRY